MRLLHVVAFSKKLPWYEPTKVISLKTQPHAENACAKRSSQRSFNDSLWFRLRNDHEHSTQRDSK